MNVTCSMYRLVIPFRRTLCPVLKVKLSQKIPQPCTKPHRSFSASAVCYFPKDEDVLPLRYIFLRTSIDMWEESPHGVTFDVGYKDSQPDASFDPKLPTIVGLPGITGTHEELNDLLLPLAKLGYRVLIPNLPGNKYTKGITQPDEDFFAYSVDERAEFLKDFLDELEITRVDMLVTNSCSVYPGLKLSLMQPDIYKSLVMINPAGICPSRMMQPDSVFRGIAWVWDRPFLRVFMKSFIFIVKPFTNKRRWKVKEIVTFSRFINGTLFDEVVDLVNQAKEYQNPSRFVILSDSDPLYEREAMEELVHELGIPESSLHVINEAKTMSGNDSNENASDNKSSAIDVTTIQGVKFLGASGDIKRTKASLLKMLLWDYLKTVRPGS